MNRKHFLAMISLSALFSILFQACQSSKPSSVNTVSACPETSNVYSGTATSQSWATAKAAQSPLNQLPSVFGTAYPQPLANLAWEDGIYITRDGLNLYATYVPDDLFSIFSAGTSPLSYYQYERGNLLGQDFSNPISGYTTPWLHADIAVAQRSTTSVPFTCWTLSGLQGQYYNRGAAVGIQNSANAAQYDYFAYTDDSSGSTNIKLLKNVPMHPSTLGANLPSNVNSGNYIEDNPHIERVNPNNPNSLVLMFESYGSAGQVFPGGVGGHDIWYSTSLNGGNTWTNPATVSIDTAADEVQPHLYYDGTSWWLYYSTAWTGAGGDGKPAIFRAQQTTTGNWANWNTPQLVVSAGTAQAVGEPSLTTNGDLSFVITIKNTNGTSTDTYDADPWFLPKK